MYLDVGIMLYVEDGDDVDGDEGAADDVHGHDQAVQVPKAGQSLYTTKVNRRQTRLRMPPRE